MGACDAVLLHTLAIPLEASKTGLEIQSRNAAVAPRPGIPVPSEDSEHATVSALFLVWHGRFAPLVHCSIHRFLEVGMLPPASALGC